MAAPSRALRIGFCAALCLSALSCGHGGSQFASGGSSSSSGSTTPTGSNVVSVVVDAGPTSTSPDINTLLTSVTVCVPGNTTSCQTIDNIQVDTGSYGLRILAAALSLTLPVQTTANGDSLLECTQFLDGYTWGPVALADVQISGESASSVPIQVIGDTSFTNVPADCSGSGPQEDTVAAFGANGVLGIGVFAQDCGAICVTTAVPAAYYACTSSSCLATTVALASQVPNPVTLFATDNNGTIIQLPSVAEQGALTVTGSLTFGIDTQSNNQSGTETVLTVDPNSGYLTTVFNAQSLGQSFIDSGSNGMYFNDDSLTQCTDPDFAGFYCPAGTQNLTATLQGQNGVTASVGFSVDNAQMLATNSPTFVAFPTLAGPLPANPQSFDWGLSFYFGRRVATALETRTTSVGTGPYIAF